MSAFVGSVRDHGLMAEYVPNVDVLAALLRDPKARQDERDDAAMYLGQSNDPAAIELLLEIARDLEEDDIVVASVGESIAEIAVRAGNFDPLWLERLRPEATVEIVAWLRRVRPDLLPG